MDLPKKKTQLPTYYTPSIPFWAKAYAKKGSNLLKLLKPDDKKRSRNFRCESTSDAMGPTTQKARGFLDVFGAWNNGLPTAMPKRLMQMNTVKQPTSGRTAHCPPLVAASYHSCSWSYSEKRASLESLLPLFEDEGINVKSTVPSFCLALFYIKMCNLELSP